MFKRDSRVKNWGSFLPRKSWKRLTQVLYPVSLLSISLRPHHFREVATKTQTGEVTWSRDPASG